MNRSLLAFLIYCVLVVATTFVHDWRTLALALAGASLVAGRDWVRIMSRTLRAILVFNAVATVSYAAVALGRHDFSGRYLLLLNTRVLLITFLTALAASRIDLLRAVSFSRTLSYLATLAMGQIATFRRLLDDFRMAMKSRTAGRAGLRDLYRHASASASYFFLKTMNEAAEITDGMKSRGFFDD